MERIIRTGITLAAAALIAFACNGSTADNVATTGDASTTGPDTGHGVPALSSVPRDCVKAATIPAQVPIKGTNQVPTEMDGGVFSCPAGGVDCGQNRCCPAGMVCDSSGGQIGCFPVCPADHPLRCLLQTTGVGSFNAGPAACCFGTCEEVGKGGLSRDYACRCPGGQAGAACATGTCPADHPTVDGLDCCGADNKGCPAGSAACGSSCCAAGSCTNGMCAHCPADHPVDCGTSCCPQGESCRTGGGCSAPAPR